MDNLRLYVRRPVLRWYWAALLSSLWLLLLNHPGIGEFLHLSGDAGHGALVFSLPCIGLLVFFSLHALFASPLLFKPFLAVTLLLASIVYYARTQFGVLFDPSMVENFLETDAGEGLSYVNARSVGQILLTGVLPAAAALVPRYVYGRTLSGGWLARLGAGAACALLAAGVVLLDFKDLAPTVRNHHALRHEMIPLNAAVSAAQVTMRHLRPNRKPVYQALAADARRLGQDARPTLFVFILGETARAANYRQNGYGRDTTPYTDRFGDVIFFRDVASCGTSTKNSVPCMFSRKKRGTASPADATNEDGLVDFIGKAGYAQAWLENDSGCKGVCRHVSEYLEFGPGTLAGTRRGLCGAAGCYDEVMLPDLERLLKSHQDGSTVIYLHIKGSHGPAYHDRVPQGRRRFGPVCETSDLSKCSREELLNAYDNTLVYSDYIVSKVLALLKAYDKDHNLGMLYVSDHGESLGENGIYLHGLPYSIASDEQTRVPMQLWLNRNMLNERGIDDGCLRKEAAQPGKFSHDNLFHSMLGLLNVGTALYDRSLDFSAVCRHRAGGLDHPPGSDAAPNRGNTD